MGNEATVEETVTCDGHGEGDTGWRVVHFWSSKRESRQSPVFGGFMGPGSVEGAPR